ncbi:MAG: hypothetical protein KGO02_07740 [Alphaproteobacteria bacterium]|nr:hypothetical protein [Alphaproteobacteria bacterium]
MKYGLTRLLGASMLVAAVSALPAAAAGNVATEIHTAALHAGFSAKSSTIKMVHAHMHHALNCLVGPKGMGFDSSALDPCKNQGNGAIVDATSAATKQKLEKVAQMLRMGLTDNTLATAKATAAKAEAELSGMSKK